MNLNTVKLSTASMISLMTMSWRYFSFDLLLCDELSEGSLGKATPSQYTFVLSVETLANVMRLCDEVRVLSVRGIETELSQYADVTTLFPEENSKNLSKQIINVNTIRIQASGARGLTWEGRFGLEWINLFETLGIIFI